MPPQHPPAVTAERSHTYLSAISPLHHHFASFRPHVSAATSTVVRPTAAGAASSQRRATSVANEMLESLVGRSGSSSVPCGMSHSSLSSFHSIVASICARRGGNVKTDRWTNWLVCAVTLTETTRPAHPTHKFDVPRCNEAVKYSTLEFDLPA